MAAPPDYRHAPVSVVSAVFGVTRQCVHKWRKNGAPCHKVGRKYLFDIQQLIAWQISRAATAAGAVPRAAGLPADSDAREVILAHVRAILEGGTSDVARMHAARLLLGEAERDQRADESRDAVIAFVEIVNDGHDRIRARGGMQITCPACGELITAE